MNTSPSAERRRRQIPLALRGHFYSADGSTQIVEFEAGGTVVGRDGGDCAITFDDPRVSTEHFVVRRRSQSWRLADSDSTNGTFVGGRSVGECTVRDGTVVRFGDCVAVIEAIPAGFDPSEPISLVSWELNETLESTLQHTEPVLLLGPSGSGKGHFLQRMAAAADDEPLVHVNCAELPSNAVAAELFGHATTAGSVGGVAKEGLVRAADGGTLFLDEIGATSPEFQGKLLTCLDSSRVRPLGATRSIPVAVRFVAATNSDLEAAIAKGDFRRDLYFRLAAETIHFPPLSQRRADILRLFCEFGGFEGHGIFGPEVIEALLLHDWPGNVRELRHLARRLASLKRRFDLDDLPPKMGQFLLIREEKHETLPNAPSRRELRQLLDDADGNVSAVARELGRHRTQVRRWIARYGLDDEAGEQ